MRLRYTLLFVAVFFINMRNTFSQSFYDLSTIQKIEINFSQSNWDYVLDTAKQGRDEYIMSNWVKINGVQFDSAGVKYKGCSSYDSAQAKNPFHINLSRFKNQKYNGVTSIKLSNQMYDPSMIREVLSYDILKNYMHCSKSNFAQVYVSGSYIGLYQNTEPVNKKFCGDHFFSSTNTFIECNTCDVMGGSGSGLSYMGSDSLFAYPDVYILESKYGWNDLIKLSDTVTSFPLSFDENIDVDRVIWMLAFNNVLVNLDSYSGDFIHNYFVYKDNSLHYNPIIWDLNLSFGGFAISPNPDTCTVIEQQQYILFAPCRNDNTLCPLNDRVFENPTYKKMYVAHAKTICDEMFASNLYISKATSLQNTIDTAVISDPNKLYSYSAFQNGLTADIYDPLFYKYIPGISNLMSGRVAFLNNTPEFIQAAPTISSINPLPATPYFNSNVTITSNVVNTNMVYLGLRYSVQNKFKRVLMYDDGLHNDGVAGDNIYGVSIPVLSGTIQYYVYAENNNAGIFSPQRAEHEFYTIVASAMPPNAGDIVINELLAKNNHKERDEYGEREDWIELYNNSSQLIHNHINDEPRVITDIEPQAS